MEVTRYGDAGGFVERAGEFLATREAEHNLILGLSSRVRHEPRLFGEDPYLAVVEDGGRVVGAALRTPPHNLVLSEMDEGALEPLVADVRAVFESLPGAIGSTAVVARFAELWQAATGARGRRLLAERIFRAERVDPPEGVAGWMRPYADPDRELALRWIEAFVAEALPDDHPEPTAGTLERRLEEPEGGFVVWEDAEPVCLAGFGGPTPNGIRIGPVYTPPELRGRGYGSALTAALTQELLDRGRRFCFLFTDLANPTSNSIYRRIGYRPVADVDVWAFG
jgi:predicted GNAT family acetyltransferase